MIISESAKIQHFTIVTKFARYTSAALSAKEYHIMGNTTKTATSHKECDNRIAVKRSGISLYNNPHAMPQTIAAIISMKFIEPICTRV